MPQRGRVPNGATVEREVPNNFAAQPYVMLNLHTPDFTTAARLTEGINNLLGDDTAQAMDAVSVKVGGTRGSDAGAGLDAFIREPLAADSPGLPNVLITPHSASFGGGYWAPAIGLFLGKPRLVPPGSAAHERGRQGAQVLDGGKPRRDVAPHPGGAAVLW